jgi:hypothetical protein
MDRDADGSKPRRPAFGRVDPFCWIPVAALVLVAVLLSFGGLLPVGIGVGFFAIALVVFDAWINRPELPTPRGNPYGGGPSNNPRARPGPPRPGRPPRGAR